MMTITDCMSRFYLSGLAAVHEIGYTGCLVTRQLSTAHVESENTHQRSGNKNAG